MQRVKFWAETLGASPIRERWAQTQIVLRGQADVPPTRYDRTSLAQLRPRIAYPLWFGRTPAARRVLISNLFNHTQTPIQDGWSVRVTQVRDFRGKALTYDSHNGTDFAVPIGTTLLAAAPGRVIQVKSEFNRGGLKVYIDHGDGLITAAAHLARALVSEGDLVDRGKPVAITGYSGLDGFLTFAVGGVPHTHYNVWLNGKPVDPFPYTDDDGVEHPSLFLGDGMPVPVDEQVPVADDPTPFEDAAFDDDAVAAVIAGCLTVEARDELNAISDLKERGLKTICEMNYYPTRFPVTDNMYSQTHERRGVLSLPFAAEAFDGIAFADEI